MKFRQNISGIMTNKRCREILISFFRGTHAFTQHVYSNFSCRYLDNQSEYRERSKTPDTLLLIDALVYKTLQPFCSCDRIRYPMNSVEEHSVISQLTGSWYFLKEARLYCIFIVKFIKLSSDI